MARKSDTPGKHASPPSAGNAPDLEAMQLDRLLEGEQAAAVGWIAAAVAQEIGGPLTAIRIAAEYMMGRECGSCAVGKRDLELILTQTDRLAALSRCLVQLALPGEPVRRPTDLNAVVAAAADTFRAELSSDAIGVASHLDPEVTPVDADPDQMHRVLLHLLWNAASAVGGGGGRIDIGTRANGKWVEMTVTDSGPGIGAESISRIFLPFYSGTGGSGLGLSLARQIVCRNGGTIGVRSAPGAGATFTVRLHKET